jgi:hypothetical protein
VDARIEFRAIEYEVKIGDAVRWEVRLHVKRETRKAAAQGFSLRSSQPTLLNHKYHFDQLGIKIKKKPD